jgi:c(7)-type cytochrome triheme protein
LILFAVNLSAQNTTSRQQQVTVRDDADFSKFKHASAYHVRLPCLLCHRREDNSARPAIPGKSQHLPCTGCHQKQFADSSSAICAICHNDAQTGSLKAFPRLTSFNLTFDHARHTTMGRVTCASCHRPANGGVAMTIPVGFNAHVTCFQCHGPQAKSGDRGISSCGTCHQPGRYVRTSQMAAAFRVGFSHAKHDRDEQLTCGQCHRVQPGLQRNEVTTPQPLNHHASPKSFSCMSCHDGKKAFGGDDFSVCKRCHQGSNWRF